MKNVREFMASNAVNKTVDCEGLRRDMTDAAFNQEYLALFVNWEGSVFHRVGEAAT